MTISRPTRATANEKQITEQKTQPLPKLLAMKTLVAKEKNTFNEIRSRRDMVEEKILEKKISNELEYIAKETADAGIDIDSLSDQEAKAKFAAEYIAFQALDLNQSGYLEKNEVAGMINWTSVQDNNGDDITFEDNKSFGEDIANYATSTLKLKEEDTKLFLKYMKEDNRGAALQLLKNKTNMDEKEFNNIVNAFKGYTEATKAFTKA